MRRVILVIAAFALCALGAPGIASATLPIYDPNTPPPGANDWNCKPTAAHPDPVVLVHGLGANAQANWYWMAPRIAAQGYCVYALTYGRTTTHPTPFDYNGGTRKMEDSAVELSDFIDRVLSATGARQVDIVGHSEGSLMPDYYLKFLPSARYADGTLKVARYVGMTPLWQGTNLLEAGTLSEAGRSSGATAQFDQLLAQGCASCSEFIAGSDFLKNLDAGPTGPRVEGVAYTMLMTTHDELVEPYTSGTMDGATNIVMQDQCAADPSEHLALAFNPNALRDILNALDPVQSHLAVDCTTLGNFG